MTRQTRQAPRISPKVRAAIEARVCNGLSIAAAAKEAGLSRTGFAKALQRSAVADLVRETQARFVAEVGAKRAIHRARALDVAMEMLNSDKTDDRVKVKLIEILLQDGKTLTAGTIRKQPAPQQQIVGTRAIPPGQNRLPLVALLAADRWIDRCNLLPDPRLPWLVGKALHPIAVEFPAQGHDGLHGDRLGPLRIASQ